VDQGSTLFVFLNGRVQITSKGRYSDIPDIGIILVDQARQAAARHRWEALSTPEVKPGSGELLASILIDADASTAFFGNKWRLSEDLLSDGAARCIARLLKSDQVWQPTE
jgi:hypothetical protein